MDKNNDIQVNKVSKWEAAPKDMGALFTYIDMVISMACCLPHEIHDNLYDLMDKTLDDYNELEAKYQEACGMISQYEEENRILREQKEELTDAHAELAEDNDNLERERDRYAYHLKGLCRTLNDNDIIADWSEAALKWSLYIWDEVKGQWCSYDKATTLESCKKHYEEELRIREKEKDEKDKLIEELKKENEELKSKNRSLQLRTNMMYACHRSTDNANRKMAKVVAEFENKNKELNRKIEELTHENLALKLKNYTNRTYGLTGKIEELEKENKELKDTLAKDREFGKNVGELIVESIREGCDKGVYKLHPCMKVEIHVEETNNMPTTFDRHAIPRISVMFNNTQTEMERDTAQHECEELNEKIDRLWSVNDELNRKIKGLTKENKELKATLAVCAVDANTAKNLCDGIVSKVKRTRSNKEEK